ncbi:MAG: hypothetical protein IIU85_01060 [Rikenellaceae bacterium]|nr:hypothetical protein [Rikenellaceae bacterium]
MKLLKFFALAAMLFGMVACNNEKTPEPVIDLDTTTAYNGTVSVIVAGQEISTTNSVIEIEPSENGKSFNIVFKMIKFVPQMPALDITIPAVDYVVADEAISFAAESIIPLCLGGEFPQYLVTGLKGTITANSIDLSLKFGEFQTSFRGIIVK